MGNTYKCPTCYSKIGTRLVRYTCNNSVEFTCPNCGTIGRYTRIDNSSDEGGTFPVTTAILKLLYIPLSLVDKVKSEILGVILFIIAYALIAITFPVFALTTAIDLILIVINSILKERT